MYDDDVTKNGFIDIVTLLDKDIHDYTALNEAALENVILQRLLESGIEINIDDDDDDDDNDDNLDKYAPTNCEAD